MNRTEWIRERTLELHNTTRGSFDECLYRAAAEWCARFARLTVIEGGAE
jgi:hypothetical protein